MKKIIFFIFAFLLSVNIFAQVSAYSFSQTSATSTPLSTPYTTHTTGTTDYGTYTGIAIGFTFNYNCVDYTTVSISNDGWIALGSSLSNTYYPLSTGSTNNVISALGADLKGLSSGSLRSKTSGTAPNRTFTVQWIDYEEYGSPSDNYDFQIILYESTNVIEFYYNTTTFNAGEGYQVGLRGNSNADFNNRTKASNNAWLSSSAGAANSDEMIVGNNATRNPQGKITFTPTATMCSGSPSGGTASVTPSPVCSGDVVTLDLSGYSTDCGVSYQWQSATTIGGPYSDISGATTVPYDYTNSGEAYYRCISTCSNGGGTGTSSVATLTFNSPTSCYCASTFSNTTDEWITNVTFNTINNNSGQEGANSYGDYTAISTNIEQGSSYLISVTFNSSYSQDVFVWFDWNQDGDFTDAGEEFQIADNVSTPTTNSLNISVPATATLGATRMRVMTYEFDDPGPCETGSYGETEDYTVVVTAGTPMSYSSSTTTQTNTSTVAINTTDNEVIGIEIVTTGGLSPISVTSFTLNTTGTTAPATDITNAKLWSTGTSSTFATTTQVGTTVSAPNGSFTINGTTTLSNGTNYFWLTYDVPTGATVGNVIDAQCTSVTVDGSAHTPTTTAPAGNRPIDLIYCASTFSNTTDEWITNVTFNTINNNSGQEGANSYGDYTGISTNIEQGSTYLISVTFHSSYTQDVFVWFDWNHDGDFTDAGEEFQIADNISAPTTNSLNISVPGTATLGSTRMRVMTYEFDDPGPCETGSYGETEDYTVNIISSVTPMSFVSCTTTQPNTTNVGQGANNKEIICVEVVTSGMISPLSVTGFRFRTTGTTNATTDIENAKVWYTGNSNIFSPTTQFGTTVVAPPTSPTNMDIGGSQTLVGGTNYFWLSYDIKSSATVNNFVDAECRTVQVSGNQTPTIQNPAGNRLITPPPPVSDDPCGATALVVNSGSCSYQTGDLLTTTTASAGIPAPGCSSLGPDIWFKFTVPASGRVIVDLDDAGGPTDMGMAWYSSSTNDCNNIDQLIDCDDDDSQNGAMPMLCYAGAICTVPGDCQQENTLTPGMTVYVRIWEYGGGTFGPFDICAYEPDPPGASSTCATATTIGSLPYSQSNTTCCRQNTYSSSVGCGSSYQDGEDYLYKYTPSSDQNIDITLTGTSSYTGVFVTDGCPDVGACVASQTESGGNPMLCGVSLTAGTTYYIMIDNDPTPSCTPFNISISESTTPICGLNYTISGTSYSWDNFFGTNIVLPVDDRFCDAYIPIPFKFCYDGYQATQLLVSSNGFVIFDPISCSTNLPSTNAAPNAYSSYSIDEAIPNTTDAPRNAILGPWHDINPAIGGVISYGVLGSAPNRRFIVSWIDAPLYGTSCGDLCTQQIKLYETTYDIEVHMKDKKLCTGWINGAAIMGLHNYNGTIAQVPAGYNYPTQWSAHHEAWKFTCNCTGCVVPLPIELIDFEGECYQNNIELTWTTASEENNQTFTIEKSVDGINFASIGTIEGAGNSNESHNYSFLDKNNGYDNVYYRLKQTDFDGTSETTRPIVVKCNSMTNNVLVSPNPVKENEPITVFGNFQTLIVKNVLGSDIKAKIEGNKILGLPKGVYFIVIDNYYTTKIVVQ